MARRGGSRQGFGGSGPWVALSAVEQSIRRKVEAAGAPLRDWDVRINYGIKTGCNEAFIIDTARREAILSRCRGAAERERTEALIRPILRGRDIRRYGCEWAGLWLIFLPWHFPLQNDGSIKGASLKAENVFREQYPAVYEHMLQFKDALSKRNKAEVGVRYEWYALQRWGAKYLDDFARPKVVWKIIGCNINYAFDSNGMMCNNAINIMVGEPNQLLQFVGLMNSKLFDWYLKTTTEAEVQGGGIQLYVTTLEKTPLKLDFTEEFTTLISNRLKGIVTDKEIDERVFSLYGLTEEEKEFIRIR